MVREAYAGLVCPGSNFFHIIFFVSIHECQIATRNVKKYLESVPKMHVSYSEKLPNVLPHSVHGWVHRQIDASYGF